MARSAAASADEYVSGEAIVRFEPDASAVERRAARRAAAVRFEDSLGLPRAELVEIDGSVAAAVRRLERQPGVAYAQPNFRYEAVAVEAPNDTFFSQLWGLGDPDAPDPGVHALEAWENNEGDGEVIAVLDTGVDLTHPDLEGNLWVNPSPDPISEDLHGYDFVDDDGDPDDYQFHGTHVAGTAAAIAGNEKGIAGVAPAAEVMAVRVLDGDGSGFTSEIAEGIEYAVEQGADVINMSLSGSGPGDKLISDAVTFAAAEDVVVVAAAGNEGSNNDVAPTTPCTLPQANLICVAALNRKGELSSFSNYGAKSVDIAAPGGDFFAADESILSAKTDYGPDPPLFTENFAAGFGSAWETAATADGIEWDTASLGGNQLATDSVGQGYESDRISALFTTGPFNLTGERGCRVHFRTMYEIEEFFDAFEAGAFSEAEGLALQEFDGTSPGYPNSLTQEQVSISNLDDLSDVRPLFRINADEIEEFDGAFVDDVRLICRDETYVDAIASGTFNHQLSSGNYVRFNGTSMAAPHVAGVAALVGAAEPKATATQVVDAILTAAAAIPQDDPSRPTATHGIADACQAIAVATGGDFEVECPGSSENVIPIATKPGGTGTVAPPPPPPPLALRTFFRKHPPKLIRTRHRWAKAVFVLGASEGEVTFVCRIDGGLFRSCPKRFAKRFGPGWHVVRAAARAADGRADQTLAVYRFRVKRID